MRERFQRYVAIGDSSTEGLNDPDGNGGYRGWSRRLAARIAGTQGELLYANFGVRGLKTREILKQQLEPAVAMRPDLVTMFSGTNDAIGPRFDSRAVARDMEHMQRTFVENDATVLTFTLPDLTPLMPLARWIAPRIHAMNEAIKSAAAKSGATVVDFASYPVATDPRLWHEDRIHANSVGHARIADALAFALGLPDTDDAWRSDLPPMSSPTLGARVSAEVRWTWRYLLPWIGRGAQDRITGKKRARKHPSLERVQTAVVE